jgi:hypothetical protein
MSEDLRTLGGVAANPPCASFLGVRSLSLVFADFATLLVFVFVFIFVLCSFFVPRCNHRWLWQDQDSCQGCEMTELLHKQLPLFRLDVQLRVFSQSCMDRSRRDEGEKSAFTLRLLWFTLGPPRLQFCTHIGFAYALRTGTFSSESVQQRKREQCDCDKDLLCARLTNQTQRYAFV